MCIKFRAMRAIFLIAICIFYSGAVLASGPFAHWGKWRIDVHDVGCDLISDYSTPGSPTNKGILTGTPFNYASFRFVANTFVQGEIVTKEDLGRIKLLLQIGSNNPRDISGVLISEARIGGFDAFVDFHRPTSMHQFRLEGGKVNNILNRIIASESIPVELEFQNGSLKRFDIHPASRRKSRVWIIMYDACIRENRYR